jgi:hypothetical protein
LKHADDESDELRLLPGSRGRITESKPRDLTS